MAEMFVEMLYYEEDQAILSTNSESEISDAGDLDQWFSNTFLEPPQHCTFCMSPLSDTPISGLGVATNELMS